MGAVLPQPIAFGKYTLIERIGRGGMAEVFKARVTGPAGFQRVFVVKRILPQLSDDPAFIEMFIQEAKMSARLSHANIVQVFELGAVDDQYFISMEYVRGRNVAETMRACWARIGPPRPELISYIGQEVCRALAYAHELRDDDGKALGVVHRDVSPSNVMLSYDGAVRLLDFGIARALGAKVRPEQAGRSGALEGKFAYMAPEQTRGSAFDHRVDIFALGVMLHEGLTGRRLFRGESDAQTIEKVRACEVPPPSLQNPLCPPELDDMILKALSRSPDDRYQSASEMSDALADVVHASRFQPAHLAALMRDLFPAEEDSNRTESGTVRQIASGTVRGFHKSTSHSTLGNVLTATRPLGSSREPIPVAPSLPEDDGDRKRVFVCYRREDTKWHAMLIARILREHFKSDCVFHDTEIPLGVDYRNHIATSVARCSVMLVVIGPRWTTTGKLLFLRRPRLHRRDDWVRMEIELGLQARLRVIPVLTAGAKPPVPGDLPVSLTAVCHLQAATVDDEPKRLLTDIQRIALSIEEYWKTLPA
jgi:serine/threonine protein kinase